METLEKNQTETTGANNRTEDIIRANWTKRFAGTFARFTESRQINEAVLLIENAGGDFSFSREYGGKRTDSPMLPASITKLFTTTCILVLLEQGKISLEEKIAGYFDRDLLSGLHVHGGEEYTFALTISDLLFQTSGLPDLYEEGRDSLKKRVIKEDFTFTIAEVIAGTKKLKPHFAPHTGRTAFYADINFDLLGEIIEKASGLPLGEAYRKYICEPLGLASTYLPESETDCIPGIYYQNKLIHRPGVVMSCRASGGVITTAAELMLFLKAFFGGRLFDRAVFARLARYHKLQMTMGPIYYGGGYMQIPLTGLTTLFMGKGELLGHSGSTGSFAFYYPLKDLFFVGDLNQMANPALPVRLAIQLALATK